MARTGWKRLKTMPGQEESEDDVIAFSKQQECGSEVIVSDRISSLPDSLLHHILSFLPTREVVATSLLSKRWRPLWHSMASFDFEHWGISTLDSFIQFVDAVLLMVDLKPIEKFKLKCPKFYVGRKVNRLVYKGVPPTRLNIWISTSINRKVKHFELCAEYDDDFVAPPSIFNSSTIRILKLKGVRLNTPSVKLPSLKVMHLVKVKLADYECLANLLSGCALLEELELDLRINDDDWELEEEKKFTVNIEMLEHLVSANVPSFLITSKALTNTTRLRINVDNSPVRDIPTFGNLTRLEISGFDDEHLNWIVECLRSCPKLEILVIDNISVYPHGEVALMQPTLDVPRCLSSHLKEFTLGGCGMWDCGLELARYIMGNARVLRTISICCRYVDEYDKRQYLNKLAACPRGSEHCRIFFK